MSKFRAIMGEAPFEVPGSGEALTVEGLILKCQDLGIPMTHPMRVFCPSDDNKCVKIGGAARSNGAIHLHHGTVPDLCRPCLLESAYGRSTELLLGPTGRRVFLLGWSKDDMVLEEIG